jgi:hypothetical protein
MVCQVVFTSIDIFIGVTVGRHDWAENGFSGLISHQAPQLQVRLTILDTSVMFKSHTEIRMVFLEYHGAHIFDRDGKLGAVVCEGARCAID